MKPCNHCQTQNRDSAKFCKRCGKVLQTLSGKEFSDFIGKDNLRETLEKFKSRINAFKKLKEGGAVIHMQMDCVILGDAGTGKTFLAQRLIEMLLQAGVITKAKPECVDAADFYKWMDDCDTKLNGCKDGVLLLTNTQKLLPSDDSSTPMELDRIFSRMRNNPNAMPVVIMTGLYRPMDTFLAHSPVNAALFEFRFNLRPFDEQSLCEVSKSILKEKFKFDITPEAMKRLEAHFEWLTRKGDGTYTNGHLAEAKADEMAINMVTRGGKCLVDEQDVQGEVFVHPTEEEIWQELDHFIGMQSVKDEIHNVINNIKEAQREGEAAKIMDHYIFTGNPGTGKTTIARIFAEVLGALGILPKGQFVEVAGKDLISDVVGGTEQNVQEAIDRAMGGVLFIDEAYGLNQGDFGKAAIDKMLPILENRRGDFVCIAAGYRDEMKDFLKMNPGLPSRFNKVINFPDYNAKELQQIFLGMMKKKGFHLDDTASERLHIEFENMYNRRGDLFGNGRDVRNYLGKAIERYRARIRGMSESEILKHNKCLTYHDLAGEGVEQKLNLEEVLEELDALVGLKKVKESLRDLAFTIEREQQLARRKNRTPRIPVNHYLFLGNPGTGKTTVARMMGKILCSLGVIPHAEVHEVKREDLVDQFVGHTAPKVKDVVMNAMGGILFIDEAYTLSNGGFSDFGQEAINTLVPLLENYKGKFVCIAAGYTEDMEIFLDQNKGLRSRFDERIHFDDYTADELYQIFVLMAKERDYLLEPEAVQAAKTLFENVCALRDEFFGNARTVRKALDKVIKNLSRRLRTSDDPSEEEMMTIKKEDINQITMEEVL